MSKPNKVSPEQIEQAQSALNLLATGADSPLTWEQAFSILEAAPTDGLQTVNAEYFEIKCGETYNMVFDGFTTISMTDRVTGQAKAVECAIVLDRDGNKFLAGQAVLVSACKQLTAQPAWIRIIVGAKKIKTAKGERYDIQIKTF
jgi:hypothetical protein